MFWFDIIVEIVRVGIKHMFIDESAQCECEERVEFVNILKLKGQ